jgi:hypothetical protein
MIVKRVKAIRKIIDGLDNIGEEIKQTCINIRFHSKRLKEEQNYLIQFETEEKRLKEELNKF